MSTWKKGNVVPVLGPLGNGFTLSPEPGARSPEKKILIGGGVGIPPLFHLAETWLKKKIVKNQNIRVFLGARNKSLLLCEKEFKKLGVNCSVATDDGSKGKKGFVTSLLTALLRAPGSELRARIYSCGPTPMLKAITLVAAEFGVPNEVSVEVPMACGFGACLGCAIKVKSRATCATVGSAKLPARLHPEEPRPSGDEGSKTDFRFAIACTEGPVFQGSEIVWD